MNGATIKTIDLDSKLYQMDYQKCFICQLSKQKKAKSKVEEGITRPTPQGYASMSRDFSSFIDFKRDSVPSHIASLYENSSQFEELLSKNSAIYHKQCRDDYNAHKLKRLEIKKKNMGTDEIPRNLSSPTTLDETNTHNVPETASPNFDESYNLAFKEVVQLIEDSRRSSELQLFKLSQLAKAMSERLDKLGFQSVVIHTSRLKDQLMLAITGFRADKIGRDIILSFEENVKHLILSAMKNESNSKDDTLEQSVNILRETYIDENETVFSGALNQNFCPDNTVSKMLVKFVSSLIGGDTADSKISENIAQLIQFNSVKNRKPQAGYVRHNIKREQPLPIYIALLVHSLSGKRSLIDELFDLGLCVSYSRLLDIERALASKVCEIYVNDDCVCPPHLTLGVFTTSAVDNIDHNPRSNSANYSFHGTGISIIQHYDEPNTDDCRQAIRLEKSDFVNKSKPSLPKTYYEIPSLPTVVGEIPLPSVNWDTTTSSEKPLTYVEPWLQSNKQIMSEDSKNLTTSWSAFNSRSCSDMSNYKSKSVMLPLIKDNVNSPSVVRHTMDIVISTTKKINPMQTPVWTGDQPVYAIGKQIQWLYPDKYGEDKLVLMLGGLHIEKSFLAVIGSWLEGSGWEEALVRSGIVTSGRAEGLLRSDHIKRTRYAHEVSLVALNVLLLEKFESEKEKEDEYHQWVEAKRKQSPQYEFWITTMELEAILLQFVKSLRTSNFEKYVAVMESMCPWYLVTDHTHYGRWLPVHVACMKKLPTINPQVYSQFRNGHFTSRQTNKKFSCISDDQLHEQNNKMVKESSSLLGMLDDEVSLIKWMVSGPEISRLIYEYKDTSTKKADLRHHEDSTWFQSKFGNDVRNLVKNMRSKDPFRTTELSTIGHDVRLMNEDSTKIVMAASELALSKYRNYVSDRLVTTKESIHAPIKQSQLGIFKVKAAKKVNKDKMKLAAANMDSNVFCKLFIACSARKGNVADFFMHENNRYPPSISELRNLRQPATKDDAVNYLLKCSKMTQSSHSESEIHSLVVKDNDIEVTATALILNVFPHVQGAFPANVMTVKDYSQQIFDKIIDMKREKYNRVDVLFDVNEENSLEELTRENCSEEKYVSWIENETKLQRGKAWFEKFLNKIKTKTQFLKVMSSNYVKNTPGTNDKIFAAEEHIVILKEGASDINFQLPIENMNTRMLLHVEDAVRNGHQEIFLSTSDFNIVNVAIYSFKYLAPSLKKLWVEVMDGKNTRVFCIHKLYEVHSDKSDVLPFFNAFTGSCTTSAFFGIGKVTAWNAWNAFPRVNSAMLKLVEGGIPSMEHEAMDIMEEFTIKMYDSTSKATKLHECRRDLFTRKTKPRTIDRIPPTRDALEQHIKRSLLQANIWTNCLREKIRKLEPTDWGWMKQENSSKYVPVWTTIPIVADHCKELISCKCAKKCSARCKCIKNQMPCTMLCVCDDHSAAVIQCNELYIYSDNVNVNPMLKLCRLLL